MPSFPLQAPYYWFQIELTLGHLSTCSPDTALCAERAMQEGVEVDDAV